MVVSGSVLDVATPNREPHLIGFLRVQVVLVTMVDPVPTYGNKTVSRGEGLRTESVGPEGDYRKSLVLCFVYGGLVLTDVK